MLNRTNVTLSANPNRLNLGSRSLALVASGINGTVTSRLHQTLGDSPRDEISGLSHSMSIPYSPWDRRPLISCSSPAGPWCVAYREAEPVVAVPVEVPSPVVRPVDRSMRDGEFQARFQPQPCAQQGARRETTGRVTKRAYRSLKPESNLEHARVRAARPVVATSAMAGG
jgi:hypothetical protein